MTAPQTPVLLGGSTDGSGDADKVKALLVTADGKLEIGASVTIDTTGLATSAKQDTLLAAVVALAQPTLVTAVTKSDSTDTTATASKGIWVGTAGDLAVKPTGSNTAVTLTNVPSGTFIPGSYQRIMSTNTTASNIVSFA